MAAGGFGESDIVAVSWLNKVNFYSSTERSLSVGIISIILSDTLCNNHFQSAAKTSTFTVKVFTVKVSHEYYVFAGRL